MVSERPLVILADQGLEYAAVRGRLSGLQTHRHPAGSRFEVGRLATGRCRVAIGLAGRGEQPAAVLAERAITEFDPFAMLSVGVAGALWRGIALGDVVVATQVYGDGPPAWEISPDAEQIARHVKQARHWVGRLPGTAAMPDIKFGALAAGPAQRPYHDALAIERAAAGGPPPGPLDLSLPVVVIRGISDRADGTRITTDREDWHPRAVANAAAFAVALADQLHRELHDRDPRRRRLPG